MHIFLNSSCKFSNFVKTKRNGSETRKIVLICAETKAGLFKVRILPILNRRK